MFEVCDQLKILLVDDDQKQLTLTKKILNYLGMQDVVSVKNALDASVALQELGPFDLVISEWEFNGQDFSGLDLYAFMRSNPKLDSIPFVMQSKVNRKEKVLQAIQKGVDHYLIKPINVSELLMRISQTLGKKLSSDITKLDVFAKGAWTAVNLSKENVEKNQKVLDFFSKKMKALQQSALNLKKPHIAYIAYLSKNIADRTLEQNQAKRYKKTVDCLWDAIQTIGVLFVQPNGAEMEECKIIINRLEKTITQLGGKDLCVGFNSAQFNPNFEDFESAVKSFLDS